MTDMTQARTMHQSLLAKLMQGPSDGEGAMRRAESMFGLSYWAQHNLRHKGRATLQFISQLHGAYLALVEKSVKRDLAYLQTEISKDADDTALAGLVSEAENIIAQIQAIKARKAMSHGPQ